MRRTLHQLVLAAAAVIASLGVAQADARMTVLYDLEPSIEALTDPERTDALDPGFDGLYQQSIAPRGSEFPVADPANPRDGSRFVAKAVGRPPAASGNCSNTHLTDVDGVPLAPGAIADLLRDGTGRVESAGCVENDPPAPDQVGVGTFASRMVFVEEVSGARWQSTTPGSLAEAFLGAITQLDAEPAPEDIPDASAYEPPPTMAERVHVYLRFPQTLTVFPERWTDLRATLPLLGGVWLETYGYGGEERRAWDEARYATLLRPFARDHLSAGGDLRRLHLLMGATVRPEVQDPGRTAGDQWPWPEPALPASCCATARGPTGWGTGPPRIRGASSAPASGRPSGAQPASCSRRARRPTSPRRRSSACRRTGSPIPLNRPPTSSPRPSRCWDADRSSCPTAPSGNSVPAATSPSMSPRVCPPGSVAVSPPGPAPSSAPEAMAPPPRPRSTPTESRACRPRARTRRAPPSSSRASAGRCCSTPREAARGVFPTPTCRCCAPRRGSPASRSRGPAPT